MALAPTSSNTSTGADSPFTGTSPQGRDLDQPLGQPQRLRREANAPRRRELLHPGRQMRGLANGRVVHVQVVADGTHDHLARVETDTDLHLHAVRAAHLGTVAADRVLHGQGGIAGPRRVIFMGQGVPRTGP